MNTIFYTYIAIFLLYSGVAVALAAVVVAVVVPNQGHILNQNQSPNLNLPNVAELDLNPSEYLILFNMCIKSLSVLKRLFICFISCAIINKCMLRKCVCVSYIFHFHSLALCLGWFFPKPLTTYSHLHKIYIIPFWKRNKFYIFNCTFLHPLHLNYNFADQETAQSRNLSQSPNPDLVLGPRLRGQNPGRSPNPKPSLPQSEFDWHN